MDWTDEKHVRRALLVFEDYIRTYRDPSEEGTPRWLVDIKVCLDRDGYHLNDEGQISWINPPVLVRDLSGLNDPSGIVVELERIRHDLTTDPQGAIGAAKQLIEATAKTALRELGVVVEKKPDVPILVAMVHKELRLDAASAPDGPDGDGAL